MIMCNFLKSIHQINQKTKNKSNEHRESKKAARGTLTLRMRWLWFTSKRRNYHVEKFNKNNFFPADKQNIGFHVVLLLQVSFSLSDKWIPRQLLIAWLTQPSRKCFSAQFVVSQEKKWKYSVAIMHKLSQPVNIIDIAACIYDFIIPS